MAVLYVTVPVTAVMLIYLHGVQLKENNLQREGGVYNLEHCLRKGYDKYLFYTLLNNWQLFYVATDLVTLAFEVKLQSLF